MRTPQFKVGTQFMTSGKHPRLCTVTDIHTTTNLAGLVVKIRYVATHEFCGQTVTDSDVCDATIARNIVI
jgi:hypothetical protein